MTPFKSETVKESREELTMVRVGRRFNDILTDLRNETITVEEAAEQINNLSKEAQAADLPFQFEISEEDLLETGISTYTDSSYGGSSY